MRPALKEAVFISLLGHAAVFGVFTLSFGPRQLPLDFTGVSFRGSVLCQRDLTPRDYTCCSFSRSLAAAPITGFKSRPIPAVAGLEHSLKPEAFFDSGSKIFWQPDLPLLSPPGEKDAKSVVMLYPALGFNPSLYFKDRRQVHLELAYRSVRTCPDAYSVMLRRKISSGNLEADLLSMRSLSRYLLIRQLQPDDSWHTVKIELSPGKNDQY